MDLPNFTMNVIGKVADEIRNGNRKISPRIDQESEAFHELNLSCNYVNA